VLIEEAQQARPDQDQVILAWPRWLACGEKSISSFESEARRQLQPSLLHDLDHEFATAGACGKQAADGSSRTARHE
jgi:hypothetical protein